MEWEEGRTKVAGPGRKGIYAFAGGRSGGGDSSAGRRSGHVARRRSQSADFEGFASGYGYGSGLPWLHDWRYATRGHGGGRIQESRGPGPDGDVLPLGVG